MAKIKQNISFNTWPKFSKKEILVTKKVMSSGKVNYWTGKLCNQFEKNFQKYFNLNYAISLANGSVALDAAVNILNLSENDEVLVTPRSYISTASCLLKTPAKIKFIDVDIDSQNISIDKLKLAINKNTKLIICVHLAGWPCDINKIKKIIGKKNILILEDCSQAHGAKINNKYVGSMGDIAVWSFCNDKIISTIGEGGMISCKSKKIYKKLWAYKDCGKNIDKILNKKSKKKGYLFKWVHDFDGTNLRMTEIQAAVGIEQLKNLKKMINKRFYNIKFIYKNIKKNNLIFKPEIPKNIIHAGYRCYLLAKSKRVRDNFINYLNMNGIDANQGSCPEIYREKRFLNKNKYPVLENANKLGDLSISLPSHHLISKKKLFYLVSKINNFLK